MVVLLHGWNGWPGNWDRIAAGLQAAGHEVYTPRLPVRPLAQSIRADAERLARYLRDTDRGGRPLALQPVVLCGYSRGGLVARAYLRDHGGAYVAGLAHVGVPHQGIPWARLRWLRPLAGLTEMAADSGFLHWLNADLTDLGRIPQLAVCGRAADLDGPNDLIVWEESASLGGRLPCAHVDLRPGTDAWHGNLINRAWYSAPRTPLCSSDRCWPLTLLHLLDFLNHTGNPG